MTARTPLTYGDAGVSLDAADEAVDRLRAHVGRTHRPGVLGSIGGFGGLFELDLGRWSHPVLVSGTDGVGTKVDLARRLGVLDTVGIDLVAMVVDDLVVVGAEPLFVNDYVSVGRLDPARVEQLVAGVAEGCVRAGAALVGGEVAEHPGLLAEDEFDLAGFGVAAVEKDELLGPERVGPDDVLVGLAASGLHSNGYSLVRRIVGPSAPDAGDGLDLDAEHGGLGAPLGELLLTPTAVYALDVLAVLAEHEVHALCHVTGGGLPGNLPRVLPDGLGARVATGTWERPELVRWLAATGPVDDDEMWRTFNMGVGMVAVVPPGAADAVVSAFGARGVDAWVLGGVEDGDGVRLDADGGA